MCKIIVLATSHKTRGGISSVILSHQKGKQWSSYHCRWIETHIDKGLIYKLFYFIKGLFTFILILPWYDLIHIHISEPPSAIRKSLFMGWAKLWRKKTIVHFHSFSIDTTIKSKWNKLYYYLFNKADVVLVLSKYWEKEVNVMFNLGAKVKVLYNPCIEICNDRFYPKTQTVLYAGALNSRKGYADLIQAFAMIASRHKEWTIAFAGNGEIEKAKELAEKLNIIKQCDFLGWISDEIKDKYFKEASIFCLPSYAEGFPMAVLDAWAYGLPVVSTPVGGLPDIAIDGENILMFKPGDITTLSKQLDKLMSNSNLRKKIGDASKNLSLTIFSEDNINTQLGKLYKII